MGDFVPTVRSAVGGTGHAAADVLGVVTKAASTGQIGDGKVWVTSVEDIVRVRTGERGPDAL